MKMVHVVSSNVEAVGYENGFIEIRFLNGSVYRYPNCTEELFSQLLSAPSKGAFVHQRLKGRGETRIL